MSDRPGGDRSPGERPPVGRSVVPVRRIRVLLALVAYGPLLWNAPGKVSADTKTYLYLDPVALLRKAPSMWDPAAGLGTVTHQTIGYLWPMGPWYALCSALGLPDWLAQRFWLGTIFFAAGCGVVALAVQFGLRWRAVLVAALAYQLSPYALSYVARLSVILLPWAGLGWLLVLTIRGTHSRRWRHAALFALVVVTIGSVNATALVLAGLAPLCWLGWAVWGSREATVGQVLGCVARFGVLTVPVSAFWIAGLWAQGRYGIPILRYTETYEAVARASTPTEVLRGLGYWFGYGRDRLSPWVDPVGAYTRNPLLVVVSIALPAAALVALARVRWRERTYCALLLVVGMVVAVGAHPFDDPSLAGRGVLAVVESSVGRALRSTPRAAPLVVLALALALGVGVDTLSYRRPRLRWGAPAAAVGLVAVNLPALWTGGLYTSSLLRDELVPAAWRLAGQEMDAAGGTSRVLDMPGSDFAAYRWGGTVDPVLPGLTDRDVAYRELVPSGSAASADLLAAVDRRWQDRLGEPAATAPLLRLLGVGDVLLRGDLESERYRLARARQLSAELATTPGIETVRPFGSPGAEGTLASTPVIDAEELLTSRLARDAAPVTQYRVDDPLPEVRAASGPPVVVAGDGEGVVDLAAAGLLDPAAPLLYAGDLVARPGGVDTALDAGAHVVVTDTNRKQARRWGSVRENLGATETVDEEPLRDDVTDNRLDLFPGAGADSYTVAELQGVSRVRATGYGNPITYTPEDRAVMAVDGDPTTAWRVGAFSEVRGERLEVDLSVPTSVDHLTLLQPLDGPRNRFITGVRLRFDGVDPLDVVLDESSRAQPGQRVEIGARTFSSLSIEITDANYTRLPGYRGISAVGFAEVGIGDTRAREYIRLPDDVLGRTGDDRRLTLVMTRQRASNLEVNRHDPEPAMHRVFTLPSTRTVDLSGTGRISPRADDATVNEAIDAGGVTAVATARLAGDPASTALAAIDNDPATSWQSPFDAPLQTLTVTADREAAVAQLRLTLTADGRHSVPTRLKVAVDGGEPVLVTVPTVRDQPTPGSVARVVVSLPAPLQGRRFDVTVDAVREVSAPDPDTGQAVVLPVGVVELGLGDIVQPLPPESTSRCRNDLVTLDGEPVSLRVVRAGVHVRLESCTGGLPWAAGEHRIDVAEGRLTGIDVDRLVVDSAATGAAAAAAADAGQAAPALDVTRTSRTGYRIQATPEADATEPYWVVLGQSYNTGWRASVDGRDLGAPTLVDGYANGWLVTPSGRQTIDVTWAPQRTVDVALAVSVAGAVGCLVVLVVSLRVRPLPLPRRARRGRRRDGDRPSSLLPAAAVVGAALVSGWVAALVVLAVVGAAFVLVARSPAWLHRWVGALALAPAGLLVVVVAYVLAKQVRYDLPTDLDWPQAFDVVQPLTWAAVFVAVPLWPGTPLDAPTVLDDALDDDIDPGTGEPYEAAPSPSPAPRERPVVLGTAAGASSGRTPSWPPGRRRTEGAEGDGPATRRPSWPPGRALRSTPDDEASPLPAPAPPLPPPVASPAPLPPPAVGDGSDGPAVDTPPDPTDGAG